MRTLIACTLVTLALAQEGRAYAQPAPENRDEAAAESEGPDRFEWLVVGLDTGYRALDLLRIEFESEDGAHARLVPATSGGFSPGLSLGVRLWFVSLKLRGDVTFLGDNGGFVEDDLQLWNLDLEGALHLTPARFQPYLLLGLGYSALGGIGDVIDNARRAADAKGANARLALGFDYYLSEEFSLGARAGVDGLLLAAHASVRDLATPESVDTLGETEDRLREADGSMLGLSYAAGLTFGVHGL
jgi:hypothetical protein